MGERIFVFGGRQDFPIDSIESLNVARGDTAWRKIIIEGFSERTNPIVCPLNEATIVVLGGKNGWALDEVIQFDDQARLKK